MQGLSEKSDCVLTFRHARAIIRFMECHIRGGTIHFEKSRHGRAPFAPARKRRIARDLRSGGSPFSPNASPSTRSTRAATEKSSPVAQFHYRDMAEDVLAFIRAQDLAHPVLYGFSDGGITALLVGLTEPDTPRLHRRKRRERQPERSDARILAGHAAGMETDQKSAPGTHAARAPHLPPCPRPHSRSRLPHRRRI